MCAAARSWIRASRLDTRLCTRTSPRSRSGSGSASLSTGRAGGSTTRTPSPRSSCRHEDRGDGVLVVLPPALPVDKLADPLPERLRGLVRVHNRVSSRDARIQLRAAAHMGPVYQDAHGYAGDAVSQLFRLLDAPPFKQSLAASGRELGFIASDYLYRNVILRHATLVDPAEFQPVP